MLLRFELDYYWLFYKALLFLIFVPITKAG